MSIKAFTDRVKFSQERNYEFVTGLKTVEVVKALEKLEAQYEAAQASAEASLAVAKALGESVQKLEADVRSLTDIAEKAEASRRQWQTLCEQAVELGKKAEAERDRLKAALEWWEWDERGYCMWCEAKKSDGHKPDCARQLALTGPQEEA